MDSQLEKGKKNELYNYVCTYKNRKDNPLETIKNPGGDVRNVINCLNSMARMIAILMQTQTDDDLILKCDLSIRIF